MENKKGRCPHYREQSAFTLIELIFAIVIIGVLASLAIPRYTYTMEKMRLAEGLQILETLRSAQDAYRTETGTYANDPDLLDVDGRQVLLRAHNRHRGDTGERQNDQHDQSFLMAIPSTAGLQSRPTG